MDTLKTQVINTLNEELQTPISVEGRVNLNWWTHFPRLSIELNQLQALESIENSEAVLLKADKVFLMLNLQKLWRQEWEIEQLAIAHGQLSMHKDKTGLINYRFLKEKSDTIQGEAKGISLKIAAAQLKDIQFTYIDDKSNVNLNCHVQNLKLSGDFSADSIALKLETQFHAGQIDIKETRYIDDQQIRLSGTFTLFPKEERYNFYEMQLSIGDNPFLLNGEIDQRKYSTYYNLKILGQDLQVNDFLKILPERFAEWAPKFEAEGKFLFETKIRGYLNAQNNPYIKINYTLDDATLLAKSENIKLENLSTKGSFNNGESHTLEDAALSMDHIKFRNQGSELIAQLFYKNFNNPYLILKLNGALETAHFGLWDSTWPVQNFNGVLNFEQFDLRGRFINTAQRNNIALKGKVSGSMLQFDWEARPLSLENFNIDFQEDQILIPKAIAMISGQKIELNGTLSTIDKWLKYTPQIKIEAAIKAENVNLLALEKWWAKSRPLDNSEDKTAAAITGTIKFDLAQISYKKLYAKNINANVELLNKENQKFALRFESMEGSGKLLAEKSGNCSTCLEIKYQLDSINIKNLFNQMDNFGQKELTAENLEGQLNSNGTLNFPDWNSITEAKQMQGNIYMNIKNGALRGFKPLESLSKFIKLDDLRNIQFHTLENEFIIKNGTIDIPEMLILSNAFTLALSGQHHFDSRIDYLIKLNIYNVLGNKFRLRKSEVPDAEMVDTDDFNFYLKMQGTTDNPIVSFDKQGVKHRFQQQRKDWEKLRNPEERKYSTRQERLHWDTEEELETIEWEK
ncbi:MAG: AsmA-like C-terminal region-containing protein [Chitinophagales bacterium]